MGKVFDEFLDSKRNQSSIRTYEINIDFLNKLNYLSKNVYHVPVNRLVSASIMHMIENNSVVPYAVDTHEYTEKHSFYIKKSLYDGLYELSERYPSIGIGKLVNIAIHDALAFEEEALKDYEAQTTDPSES